jgi:hypothetical protein
MSDDGGCSISSPFVTSDRRLLRFEGLVTGKTFVSGETFVAGETFVSG